MLNYTTTDPYNASLVTSIFKENNLTTQQFDEMYSGQPFVILQGFILFSFFKHCMFITSQLKTINKNNKNNIIC